MAVTGQTVAGVQSVSVHSTHLLAGSGDHWSLAKVSSSDDGYAGAVYRSPHLGHLLVCKNHLLSGVLACYVLTVVTLMLTVWRVPGPEHN